MINQAIRSRGWPATPVEARAPPPPSSCVAAKPVPLAAATKLVADAVKLMLSLLGLCFRDLGLVLHGAMGFVWCTMTDGCWIRTNGYDGLGVISSSNVKGLGPATITDGRPSSLHDAELSCLSAAAAPRAHAPRRAIPDHDPATPDALLASFGPSAHNNQVGSSRPRAPGLLRQGQGWPRR
jgi:hypothetical protein